MTSIGKVMLVCDGRGVSQPSQGSNCVVEGGWTLRRAAERFLFSPATAQRRANRYRQFGEADMCDRSSCHTSPRRTRPYRLV